MRTDTEGLLHIFTTLRTLLRGVVRRNGNHLATSIFGFVLQELSEHSPGCINYGKCQTMVSYHVGNLQIFNDDGLIAVHVLVRGFMKRVLSLVGNTLIVIVPVPLSATCCGLVAVLS